MRRSVQLGVVTLLVAVVAGWTRAGEGALKVVPDIEARVRAFASKPLAADLSVLSAGDRKALDHLVSASRRIHEVFRRQAWAGNFAMAKRIAALTGPGAEAARTYYRIMAKPWDELRRQEPFVGETMRPAGAGFYPEDLDRAWIERWISSHPNDRSSLVSPYTVVRRKGDGLVAVGYGSAYADLLRPAAKDLRAAAAATSDERLAKYLRLRAQALLDDDYFASDMAWMDLDGLIEVVIGPYETYEDSLFGYKASFESFVCVSQPADSKALEGFKKELPFLERNLPIPDSMKNLKRGAESPIRVADVVFAAGDARSGVQTIAFNLPNDERVREAKGSKKVLLKNMMRAKYEAILVPIAQQVLPPGDAARVDFDSYFHFILFHEMSHGLGPGRLNLEGRETEVRLELKELYSAIEEAKADVVGAYDLYALADRGLIPASVIDRLPWTYVAGLFRTARFGTAAAHGLGVVVQTNSLLQKGGIEVTDDGRFRPVASRFRAALTELATELLGIEARGDYPAAKRLVETRGEAPEAMKKGIARLTDIPVDVDPFYTLFESR